MKIERIVTGPFQENCYLVRDDRAGVSAIVDPGADGEVLVEAIRRSGTSLVAVWLTHAHVDHIGAVSDVTRAFKVPVFLHAADLPLYRAGFRQAAVYGLPFEQPTDPDRAFTDGMTLTLGAHSFEVMHSPGHAPGHVVIHGAGVAFVGDCLFAGSIGRTDLPLSNGAQLEQSLSLIAALPPETRVLPGHGPETTIATELRQNPFLSGVARPVR